MTQPLSGIRVLDLTNVLAGPFCCHQLAHFGADVIKVETPQSGDLARQLGADATLNKALMGVSFLAQNPGKRSITVNLKHAQGRAVLHRLVAKAHVLVENFRPGVMDRLGVGYRALLQHNPTLVYCAISGFGQDGPLRECPAYDQIIQGMSGMMSITGTPETAPVRVGYPVADTIGGMTAAFAIAATLADRDRVGGRFIDVSMLEAAIATMGWAVSNHLIADRTPAAMGNDNMTASPSGTFRTRDGLLNIAANKQEQFEDLCDVIDRPALKHDPRFVDRHVRLRNRAELTHEIEQALASEDTEVWWHRLIGRGVPAGPVFNVPQALSHPQIRDRGMIAHFDDAPGVGRDIRLVRTGVKLDGKPPSVDAPPPTLGQHSDQILHELGFTAEEVAKLREEGAI